jgi:hypothetical protein
VPTIKTGRVSSYAPKQADNQGKDGHGKVFVDPLEETIVSTPQDVVDILSQGNRNRKTGATDWVSSSRQCVS